MVLRLHLPTITLRVASKIPEESKFKDQRDKEPPIFEHWTLFVTFYERDFSSLAQKRRKVVFDIRTRSCGNPIIQYNS